MLPRRIRAETGHHSPYVWVCREALAFPRMAAICWRAGRVGMVATVSACPLWKGVGADNPVTAADQVSPAGPGCGVPELCR
jgi:hypothetical protein